jgi:hypothetical protein
VKKAGDTMTGQLTITPSGGYTVGGSVPTTWASRFAGRTGVVNGNDTFYFDTFTSPFTGFEFSTYNFSTTGTLPMVFQANGGNSLFGTNGVGTPTSKVTVNGNVSIGGNVAAPTSGLRVSGTTNSADISPITNATYALGTSSLYWTNIYAARHYLNSTVYLDGATAGSLTAATGSAGRLNLTSVGNVGNSVLSLLNINNDDTGAAVGTGMLFSAGSTGSFIGGVVSARTDAASNSIIGLRVLSNGSLSGSSTTTTPFFVQGSVNGTTTNSIVRTFVSPSLTATSGSLAALTINPLYNQVTSTASNTDLLINRTETSLGSGAQLLADFQVGGSSKLKIDNTGTMTYADAANIAFGTTTGTKHGTATTQKQSFWNATPIVQPTTAVTAAAFVGNTSGTLNDSATYGGYTIGQVVAALKAVGLLA